SSLMRQSVREERLLARLATGFGLGALLLAAIGLYGVMTYAVTRRTGEIGLRVALGAQRPGVVRLVVADALRVVLLGFAVGLPIALGSLRLLHAQLYGIEATDPYSTAAALAVLLMRAMRRAAAGLGFHADVPRPAICRQRMSVIIGPISSRRMITRNDIFVKKTWLCM